MYCIRSIINLVKKPINNVIPLTVISDKMRWNQYQPLRFITNVEVESEKLIEHITRGNPDSEKKLRILMLEVEVMRQDGRCAPTLMNLGQWEHLYSLNSKNQRISYLGYLWKSEKSRENQKAKKEARKKELETYKPEETKEFADDIYYGLQHQSLFLRIRDQSINHFDNYRTLQAMSYGLSVVIDCSYEDNMITREALNAAKQMTFVFGDNRLHKDPFNIHMCNVNFNGQFMKQLTKFIPSLHEPWFPMNIHRESYLDIFPKNKLVYLTPHCREELTNYDHDAVYIVGCMVDRANNEPLSLAKAKRDGIKMAKLPLDRYLEWAPGSKKNININHMVPILLDLKLNHSWDYALRHIPRRKLMETKIMAMENKIKKGFIRQDMFKNLNKNSKFGYNSPFQQNRHRKKSLYDE